MNSEEIKRYLEDYVSRREQTMVVVDFGNVEKWKYGLGWRVGIRELAVLVKRFTLRTSDVLRLCQGAGLTRVDKV